MPVGFGLLIQVIPQNIRVAGADIPAAALNN
jgi:hypothetical protein